MDDECTCKSLLRYSRFMLCCRECKRIHMTYCKGGFTACHEEWVSIASNRSFTNRRAGRVLAHLPIKPWKNSFHSVPTPRLRQTADDGHTNAQTSSLATCTKSVETEICFHRQILGVTDTTKGVYKDPHTPALPVCGLITSVHTVMTMCQEPEMPRTPIFSSPMALAVLAQ